MPDPLTTLSKLRRPHLLVRAAHLGLHDYNRNHHLRRLLPDGPRSTVRETFLTLIAQEAEMDAERIAGGATYSVARHIEMLVALIFEARILKSAEA